MNREVARLNQRHCPPLAPGQEWWTATTHEMTVRLRAAQDRGEVQVLGRVELAPGVHGALVHRLRPRRPAWHGQALAIGGVSLMVLALLALAKLAVSVVVLIWPILAILAVLYGGLRLTTGHRPVCAGLHCPGCRR